MSYHKVLVTGGAGFLGSHLVDELVRVGFKVTVLDDFSTGRIENISCYLGNDYFNLVNNDVRNKRAVDDALQDIEVVFHSAAITSVPYSVRHQNLTYEVNLDGTRNLLEGCLRRSVERFIYVSTCAVYGEPEYLPIDENHLTNPISPYADSKLKAEQVCKEFHEDYGLRTVILRPFNIYGPRQRSNQYSGVIANFIKRLHEGKPPIIYGDGFQTRDFMHVKDAIRAFMLTLNRDGAECQTLNIASGTPTTINQIAHLLIELFNAEGVKPQYVNRRRGDIKQSYANVREAELYLGFKSQISLKEGLSKLVGELKFD